MLKKVRPRDAQKHRLVDSPVDFSSYQERKVRGNEWSPVYNMGRETRTRKSDEDAQGRWLGQANETPAYATGKRGREEGRKRMRQEGEGRRVV